jgi:hypothetical protein
MADFNTFCVGKFPDVVVACVFTIDAGLDTRAEVCYLREDEVDFCGDASDIETADI